MQEEGRRSQQESPVLMAKQHCPKVLPLPFEIGRFFTLDLVDVFKHEAAATYIP